MSNKTHWTNWEIETIQAICDAGASGADLQELHDAIPLPQNRGWTTFNSALTDLADKLRPIGLQLGFKDGRAALTSIDLVETAA